MQEDVAFVEATQQCVQADLVVRAALEPPSRRGAFFRFVGWFSHQAANASRWAATLLCNLRYRNEYASK